MASKTQVSPSELPAFFDTQSDDLKLAAEAALAAGEIVKSGYHDPRVAAEINAKAIGDLVSQIDIDADKAAASILSQTGTPILSEEISPNTTVNQGDLWIVDPLDGSTAYLMKAGPQFTSVLIAKCRDGEPILGITYFPLTGEWFYATKGEGAFKNGQPLKLPPSEWRLDQAWVEMNQYGNVEYESDFFAGMRNALRSSGGALIVTSTFPYAGVAMRIAEQTSGLTAAIHDNGPIHLKQGPWDIAANQIIFEEAGGFFLNPKGEPTSPFVAEPIIVAPSKELAMKMIELNDSAEKSCHPSIPRAGH